MTINANATGSRTDFYHGPIQETVKLKTLLVSLAESQPEKSEASSDNEGDPAYRLRHRPVPNDESPLRKNPHQMKQRHQGEDYPSHKRKRFLIHERSPKFLLGIAFKETVGRERPANEMVAKRVEAARLRRPQRS